MTLEGTPFSHYRLLTLIGRGGMGEVYLAEDTQIQRRVAAKIIRIETVQGDQQMVGNALHLFWREATAIGKLDHPSILPLYDYGETVIENLHVAYLIMPYRPEGSLATWLRTRTQTQHTRQLTLKQVVHVIQQACQGLQYAHDRAVMHLDVKPANFLIRSRAEDDEYPDLLLSDFGIARLVSATSSTGQHLSGTPTYMAPEQCLGRPVFASDQYALGIMAYELLTGSPPFQGSPMSVMFAHVHTQPEPARNRNPLLPPVVDLILQRALAKKPEERFPSIATFAQVFQQAFQDVPEESTLRLLRPSLPTSSMPGAPSVHTPVVNDTPVPNSEPTQLPPVPAVDPADTATFSAPRSVIEPMQAATPSASSTTLPPPVVPVRPKRRRSAALAGVLILLSLLSIAATVWGIPTLANSFRATPAPTQFALQKPTISVTPTLGTTPTSIPTSTSTFTSPPTPTPTAIATPTPAPPTSVELLLSAPGIASTSQSVITIPSGTTVTLTVVPDHSLVPFQTYTMGIYATDPYGFSELQYCTYPNTATCSYVVAYSSSENTDYTKGQHTFRGFLGNIGGAILANSNSITIIWS
jgi:serine/threonine protein kinase